MWSECLKYVKYYFSIKDITISEEVQPWDENWDKLDPEETKKFLCKHGIQQSLAKTCKKPPKSVKNLVIVAFNKNWNCTCINAVDWSVVKEEIKRIQTNFEPETVTRTISTEPNSETVALEVYKAEKKSTFFRKQKKFLFDHTILFCRIFRLISGPNYKFLAKLSTDRHHITISPKLNIIFQCKDLCNLRRFYTSHAKGECAFRNFCFRPQGDRNQLEVLYCSEDMKNYIISRALQFPARDFSVFTPWLLSLTHLYFESDGRVRLGTYLRI